MKTLEISNPRTLFPTWSDAEFFNFVQELDECGHSQTLQFHHSEMLLFGAKYNVCMMLEVEFLSEELNPMGLPYGWNFEGNWHENANQKAIDFERIRRRFVRHGYARPPSPEEMLGQDKPNVLPQLFSDPLPPPTDDEVSAWIKLRESCGKLEITLDVSDDSLGSMELPPLSSASLMAEKKIRAKTQCSKAGKTRLKSPAGPRARQTVSDWVDSFDQVIDREEALLKLISKVTDDERFFLKNNLD